MLCFTKLAWQLYSLILAAHAALYAGGEHELTQTTQEPLYPAIVLMHGINAQKKDMDPIKDHIRNNFNQPAATTFNPKDMYILSLPIDDGEWRDSFIPIEDQIDDIAKKLNADENLKNKAIILIGHSQGGIVARGYVQKYNNPPIHTLITLGSPHRGICGMPGTFDNRFRFFNWISSLMHIPFYWQWIQNKLSVANLWNEPTKPEKYRTRNKLLPRLNNEIDHEDAVRYRNNLTNLEHFIMVASTQETIVDPTESAHFNYYEEGSRTNIQDVRKTPIWEKLGLQTLAEQGKLESVFTNCAHEDYPEDAPTFNNIIVPAIMHAYLELNGKKASQQSHRFPPLERKPIASGSNKLLTESQI